MVHVPIDVILKNEKDEELPTKDKTLSLQKNIWRQFLSPKEEKNFLHKAQKTQTIQEKKEIRLCLKFTICMWILHLKWKDKPHSGEDNLPQKELAKGQYLGKAGSSSGISTQEKQQGHHPNPTAPTLPTLLHTPRQIPGRDGEPPRERASSSTRSLCQVSPVKLQSKRWLPVSRKDDFQQPNFGPERISVITS